MLPTLLIRANPTANAVPVERIAIPAIAGTAVSKPVCIVVLPKVLITLGHPHRDRRGTGDIIEADKAHEHHATVRDCLQNSELFDFLLSAAVLGK
jgi:hypothetical protein